MSSYGNDNKDHKYEYNRLPLKGSESKYIYIPLSVIVDDELDTKGVGILSYLKIHSGLNDVVGFTVNDMVEWCGLKPNKREGKSNDNFLEIMDVLSDRGYFTYLTEHSRSSYMKCKMDSDYYYNECSNGYAVVYLDELEKILNYKDSKGSSLLNTYILLVFAYFRYKIMRRPNELKPEERSEEGIEKRRARIPDAYSSTISDMADELGIHKQTFSKIVDILEEELKLIVTDRAYRVKVSDSKYKTLPTIFANAYKREDKYLLAAGEDYSRTEIEIKAENIKISES